MSTILKLEEVARQNSGSSGDLWNLAFLFTAFALSWAAAFYAIAHSESLWGKDIPSSSRPSENCRYVKARNVLGVLHAFVVSVLVLPVVWMVAEEQNSVRFASSEHLTTCMQTEHPEWTSSGQAVALAGLLFTAFLFADIIISWIHDLASWDYVVHHVAFISAGLIIRGHCILPYNAAILLAMEASTPFLNVMLFFRNRGPAYNLLVQASGIIFVMLFVLFRLVLNTYGAILLWQHRASAMPESVPEWQRCFLIGAIAAGSALQFFWFPAIAKIFCKGIMNLLAPQSQTATHSNKCSSGVGSNGSRICTSSTCSNNCQKSCVAKSCRSQAVVHSAQTAARGSGVAASLEISGSARAEPDTTNKVRSQASDLALRFPPMSSWHICCKRALLKLY